MRASFVGILAVAAMASAAPAGPTPLTSAAGNKQTAVMKKPVLSRKASEQPSRDARQGRRRPGQPYYTGHRSVAFLTMGQIDVMQPFPDATGSASPPDPCSGCCSTNGDSSPAAGGSIHQGAPSGQVVSPTHMSMKEEPGFGVMDVDGLESMANSTNDRCLGCCDVADEMFTLSHDGMRTEGGAGDPSTATAPKETGSGGSRTTTRNNPSQRPREKITRWGSSAVSSSEEGGIGQLIIRRREANPSSPRRG
ncbi:uncharacterized protein [Ambystoma mexicanum]|uniref:uncharacterized protein isoform X2 n=1 Tax=Ambystoma mexicanum TaxID=8296 RepID=UPI0037E917D9